MTQTEAVALIRGYLMAVHRPADLPAYLADALGALGAEPEPEPEQPEQPEPQAAPAPAQAATVAPTPTPTPLPLPSVAPSAEKNPGRVQFPNWPRSPGGVCLRAWRKIAGVSSHDLAAALGVDVSCVYAWERGASRPSRRNAAAVQRATGVRYNEIASRVG